MERAARPSPGHDPLPASPPRLSRARFLRSAAKLSGLTLILAACSGGANNAPASNAVPTAIVPPTVAPQNAGQTAQGSGSTAAPTTAPAAAAAVTPTASSARAAATPDREVKVAYGTEQFPSGNGLDPQVHGGTIDESRLRNIYECLVQF